ncbi:hypothetical protein SAMN04487764_1924 [Gillisia sp. Hel1_33_143]|uniref:hypothetical protein n=1 Tax=unclassified Gillisia TaxID=2615025 RepID=UPI000553B4A3|nr:MULTISPECIES: hypothetical protein [unclassified Gillisia]SDS30901.1 hypothetical protein SAMN04487764_1924 [Gillisia sp. Hel1_33_143]
MPTNNLKAIISKIILFYSVFFVVMKVIAILFENAWPLPNLILAIPFLIFAIIGGLMMKKETYSWIYVIIGVIVISALRYYEASWMVSLHEYFS